MWEDGNRFSSNRLLLFAKRPVRGPGEIIFIPNVHCFLRKPSYVRSTIGFRGNRFLFLLVTVFRETPIFIGPPEDHCLSRNVHFHWSSGKSSFFRMEIARPFSIRSNTCPVLGGPFSFENERKRDGGEIRTKEKAKKRFNYSTPFVLCTWVPNLNVYGSPHKNVWRNSPRKCD